VKQHSYKIHVDWTGNDGAGTTTYQGYRRDHTISAAGKRLIEGSSDPAFRGDRCRYNPEELLVASLSTCHMLWFLHLCSSKRISVIEYRDDAIGVMEETADGSGAFTSVRLNPKVRISDPASGPLALAIHEEAHRMCFIARSVNFPVTIDAELAGGPASYISSADGAASNGGNRVKQIEDLTITETYKE
jgi:organic hydroperoxide reductase OsmC/OhrA